MRVQPPVQKDTVRHPATLRSHCKHQPPCITVRHPATLRSHCKLQPPCVFGNAGNTPLHFCFTYGYGDTLGAYLITKGADPSLRNEHGQTCYEGVGKK